MHIIAKKEILSDYINIVSRAMPAKSSHLDGLNGILIKASEDGKLEFAASDSAFTITANAVQCDTWSPGAVVMPPKFVNVIRALPSEFVKIQATPEEEKRCRIQIHSGDTSFVLSGMKPDYFPALPKSLLSVDFQMKVRDFKEMLNTTIFATAQQSPNPILEGLCIKAQNGTLYAMATDTYRVAIHEQPCEADDFEIIIPAKILGEINKIITSDTVLDWCILNNEIQLGYEDFVISARLLDGKYPDLLRVFPAQHTTTIETKTEALRDLICRALLINCKIQIEIIEIGEPGGTVSISAVDTDGTMVEKLEANTSGDSLRIFLNASYLNDVLRVLTQETVTLKFNGSLSPCVIEAGENYKYLVLPIQG